MLTSAAIATALGAAEVPLTARDAVARMGCGVNLGNTLEPPQEGAWNNPPAEERYFREIREAGFTWVRLPIHWGAHLATEAPYALDPAWMARVDQVLDWALAADLYVSFDAHHEQWLKDRGDDPAAQDRFVGLWAQIAERTRDKSPRLIFELLHDPVGMTSTDIDSLNTRCLAAIRATQPARLVAISSLLFPRPGEVLAAKVPDDPFVLGTVYFFHPPTFTFEGAGTWGSEQDLAQVREFCASLVLWSEAHHLPLVLREFGVTNRAAPASREAYYRAVSHEARAHGLAFAVWDDGGEFALYERATGRWSPLKDVLMPTIPGK